MDAPNFNSRCKSSALPPVFRSHQRKKTVDWPNYPNMQLLRKCHLLLFACRDFLEWQQIHDITE